MKHNKLFAVLAMAATLALSACGGAGSSAEHIHAAADNAPWQHDNNYHWKDCKDNDGGKVDNTKHTFAEGTGTVITAATCEQKGKEKVKCTVCGAEVERDIPALNHLYAKDADGNDIVTWTKEASCEEDGEGTKTCTRPGCGHVENVTAEKLGHLYAQDEEGNDIVTWTREASCELGGEGTKACTRPGCTHVEPVTTDPLGHKMVLSGEPTEPEAGKATVRVYTCENGCGQSTLGFRANEVTEASKPHLVFSDPNEKGEVGARFWGRPIGNDVELNESGDPSESSHDAVFNDQQTGDFFEYVFDLTQDQVNLLGETTYLYCDATPAQWMRNNNMDFFACKPGDTDWTRGMYIDDIAETEENEKGTEIDDYRYILYVDGQPKAFDPEITNPVRSDNRAEFKLPYAFHLHTGENSISLRMAGGYRSTFYNFIFRSA